MSQDDALLALREQIDSVDEDIQALINQRAALAQQVGKAKMAAGEGSVFYRPEREAQLLRRVKARNAGPLSAEDMARVFRSIMSACLALEEPLRVAYLGPNGTFSHGAALKQFGPSMECAPMDAIAKIFREVEAKSAHYGIVPIENSTEGVVNHTLDVFIDSPLKICGEVAMPIHHHLMRRGDDTQPIQRIYSHQQALAQCRDWLDINMHGVEEIAVSSTAYAAKLAAEEQGAAAIASEMAAEQYDLYCVHSNIEDNLENVTRFLALGHETVPPSGYDKTSLLLIIPHISGSLLRTLNPFDEYGINMTFIEVRPCRHKMWDYVFFIDVDGHQEDEAMQKALNALEQKAVLMKVLGSYPKAALEG